MRHLAPLIAASTIVSQLKSPDAIGSLHTRVGGQAGTATLIDSGAGTTTGVSLLNPATPVGTYSVSQLDDAGGSNRHIVQATSANQPVLDFTAKVNGYVPVKWDGTNDLMQTSSAFTAMTAPYTVWIACKLRSALNSVYAVSGADSTHQGNIFTASAKWVMGTTGTNFQGSSYDTVGVDIAAVFNGASSILYVRSAATTGTITNQFPTKWTLGARYDSAGFCPLTLYELAVFTKALSATEVGQLRNYAKAAYSIT